MEFLEGKKTLVLGASVNPERYAYRAVMALLSKGIPVTAVGRKDGYIDGIRIQQQIPENEYFDTVTLYLNPINQQKIMGKIIAMKPRRIIFNPGTENPAFISLAGDASISVEIACTLVMLSTGVY